MIATRPDRTGPQHPSQRARAVAHGADPGSVVVELVVLAPVLVALMLFVVFVGRAGGAVEQVRHAADQGARAASLVSRASMPGAASAAASGDLTANGSNCSSTS